MPSILADNLKRLCAAYGLSHNDLAKKSGIRQSIISRIIKGTSIPRESTIQAIATALNVDPWQLRTSIYVIDETTGEITKPAAPQESAPRSFNHMRSAIGDTLVFKSPLPSRVVDSAVLLDDAKRTTAWRDALRKASDGGDEPMLLMTMPTDDLAPVVPRGALLYVSVESNPEHPSLLEDAPAIGVLTLTSGEKTLVLGYPSVSLGRVTLKTAIGQSVAVDKVVAYVKGWTVFKTAQKMTFSRPL